MKAKKTAPSRRRISFAVDREEIEINSDWVAAVMGPPPAPPAVPSPAPVDAAAFFVSDTKTATDAEHTPAAPSTTVAESAPAETVVEIAPVAQRAPDANDVPVALSATVAETATAKRAGDGSTVEQYAPVAENAAGVESSAAEETASAEQIATDERVRRSPRRRPIARITDGLTPGQFAVYSLMFGAGEAADGSAHIYKGGYADLGRLTGLSKRGIQNIVAELQAKQVIRIHQQPGYHRTQTSAYLVPDADSVLRTWFSKGWRFALGKSKTLTA